MKKQQTDLLRPGAILKRWSSFLDGPLSLAVGVLLGAFRMFTPLSLPRIRVPVRIKGMEDPVFCRPGTTDFHTLLQIWDDGEYDAATEFADPPVETVVDLGSNIGLSARYFAALWPAAEILAVEPDPDNVALARRNLTGLVQQGRVTIENCFVGSESGYAASVRDADAGRNEFRIGPITDEPQPAAVPVKTMPQLLANLPEGSIDFLKCDIEGSESDLFGDASAWISRVRAFVVELHGIEPEWLFSTVRRSGAMVKRRQILPVAGYDLTLAWARLAPR